MNSGKIIRYQCVICSMLVGFKLEDFVEHLDFYHKGELEATSSSNSFSSSLKQTNPLLKEHTINRRCWGGKDHELPAPENIWGGREGELSCVQCSGPLFVPYEDQLDPKNMWAPKNALFLAKPVKGGIGEQLLKKMGWDEGSGLGKNGQGILNPVCMMLKNDRKGLGTSEKVSKKKTAVDHTQQKMKNLSITSSSKQPPVSVLNDFCLKKKWSTPQYEIDLEEGPYHKRSFRMKVFVNGKWYTPRVTSATKKDAKHMAALACLESLGWIRPETTNEPPTNGSSNLSLPSAQVRNDSQLPNQQPLQIPHSTPFTANPSKSKTEQLVSKPLVALAIKPSKRNALYLSFTKTATLISGESGKFIEV